MNYRFDERSEEQFKHDIRDRTMEERSLFLLWLDLLEKDTGKRPHYKDTGCGKTGDFLEDGQVSTDPDFEVEGFGHVEVKFSKPRLKTVFHLKASQVKQYVKQGATILMVIGTEEDVPEFTMLKPDALKRIVDSCSIVNWKGFGHKPAYRISVKQFLWRPLK